MYKVETGKHPVLCWASVVEEGCWKQINNLSNLPFVWKHVAIMPDTHQGYGMPIGGVLAADGVVIPNAVGVDIGCGMVAIKTSLSPDQLPKEKLKEMMGDIRTKIPVGFSSHEDTSRRHLVEHLVSSEIVEIPNSIVGKNLDTMARQVGTMGGGNHFLEIQKGNDGHVWIMIHSGSRNLGKQVCEHYDKIAKELNAKWSSNVPAGYDLAYLPIDTPEGKNYLAEMNAALEFAMINRATMMKEMKDIFRKHFPEVVFESEVNIHHNYAALEEHFGKEVVVHRKGATSAREGQLGIIPGSQGTFSYIVMGKGNPASFMSCSHGAGRVLARNEAKRTLNLQNEIKKLDDIGVVHGVRNVSDLDEAPSCYKPIQTVMKDQEDLVDIVVELLPMAVVKG